MTVKKQKADELLLVCSADVALVARKKPTNNE